ncbi:SGNH/GDSL hydrolase family protein [Janthinobacterium sp. CG_S6]|uniref:SGNH/GDSL hydrolase family protein n=1 Tax=unclassified Janthinobacterium TaxID=2610881 RepID=UPI00034B8C8B|nr:lysophospholipase L1-like esterase [Janthinobacterium sp. CG_S6]
MSSKRTPPPSPPRPAGLRLWRAPALAALLAMAMLAGRAAHAADTGAWIGTWSASPQPTWGADFAFPTNIPATLQDQTIRQVARISLGGKRVRVALSNEYGSAPLRVGSAHIALAGAGSAIVPGTDRPLTFGGNTFAVVPPGAPLLSDPVDLALAPLASVAVSVFLPHATAATTFHWDGRQTAYLAPGEHVASARIEAERTTTARIFLSGIQVEVEAAADAGAVVVLGDSISDGNGAGVDANARWPDFLAARLAPRKVAVLNAGISGARLLGDRMGANALARFERDVLSQPRLKSVVVLLGINDISWPGTAFDPHGVRPSAEALIAGYRQLIARAHLRGVRVVGATLTPFEGALAGTPLDNYYHADKDQLRQAINAWIRGGGEFDAVLDFDALLRDPARPRRLRSEFDSGDHLHPGERGNRAMADAVDLDVLF